MGSEEEWNDGCRCFCWVEQTVNCQVADRSGLICLSPWSLLTRWVQWRSGERSQAFGYRLPPLLRRFGQFLVCLRCCGGPEAVTTAVDQLVHRVPDSCPKPPRAPKSCHARWRPLRRRLPTYITVVDFFHLRSKRNHHDSSSEEDSEGIEDERNAPVGSGSAEI